LILTLILLPPKGGLGAQPQGFDFVFLPEGHHVLYRKNKVWQKRSRRSGEDHPSRAAIWRTKAPKALVFARRA
ncbi:MAG: hypothetical protein HW380_3965, partial [Magnetococcales bacterium]|nr:hypothetical protein [Magnetococcales bacterium]